MNIKITIRDADSNPLLMQKNQLSQLEFQKKNALYQQPQRDKAANKKQKSVNSTNKVVKEDKRMRQTGQRGELQQQQYKKAERKMMEDLDKMSKNQASLEMVQANANVLRKQNEILEENQRTLHEMAKSTQPKLSAGNQVRQYEYLLGQIRREVQEMKKIKEEIDRSSKELMRTAGEAGKQGRKTPIQKLPNNINEMNSNLKNLAQISKNQLEGLQNLQVIKNLQNFNMQGYSQAINSLKKQIVQYQKQSEQIERQLKLRAAKLQKMQVRPNFDQELLTPYQDYLKKKAQAVDLYAIKDRIYQKLGVFDYAKFQVDVNQTMADVKGELNEFYIVCKQYKIDVPDIKIDQKELKGLELKLPSAIEQYKAERGIDFGKQVERVNEEIENGKGNRKKGEPIVSLKSGNDKKGKKLPQAIRQLNSKPLDLATQVKLQKGDLKPKTVLQGERERERKLVQGNMRKAKKGKEDDDFEKYLEYRAREELELMYKEKKERLQKKQQELFEYCKDEPEVYLNFDMKNEIKKEISRQKKYEQPSPKKSEQQKRQQPKKEEEEHIPQLKPISGSEGQTIKSVGTEVLREKLKNLLGGVPKRAPEPFQQNVQMIQPETRLENVAQNFLGLINNTLTQVNDQLSRSIQAKYEQRSLSRQKHQRRSPPKITIPKLQQIRPPPVFNMPVYPPSDRPIYQPPYQPYQSAVVNYVQKPRVEQKIVEKDYDHLRIKDEEQEGDLEISQDSYTEDFQ